MAQRACIHILRRNGSVEAVDCLAALRAQGIPFVQMNRSAVYAGSRRVMRRWSESPDRFQLYMMVCSSDVQRVLAVAAVYTDAVHCVQRTAQEYRTKVAFMREHLRRRAMEWAALHPPPYDIPKWRSARVTGLRLNPDGSYSVSVHRA